MNHKRKFANSLLTQEERSIGVNVYDGKVWEESKKQKAEKVKRQMDKAKIRREERRKERAIKHKEFLNSHKK